MSEFGFHPLVASWFASRFAGPTEPQRRGWPEIAAGRHTLIAAPTGSGKTLTAFLAVIDRLYREAAAGRLADELRVVYVSPLRALSNDMHRNLETPLAEMAQRAADMGFDAPALRVGLRTGDTPAAQRAALVRRPPHILVTTPESLYLLLTTEKGRAALRAVDTVIVDEIHALVRDKRGAHLALSLERLAALSARPLQRIGLSATQKPLGLVAEFLVGTSPAAPGGCAVVDVGHQRRLDLAVDVPMQDLGAVCTHEQWGVVHHRLVELIQSHRSTLIFVNTRRLAERLTHQLSELLGPDQISSHHGSLSTELRLQTEQGLKNGRLKAVVATASLELGLDIGYIDLVVQIGSPRSIATFLQRIGRSGHSLHAIPKGRLFPLSRDELLECLALLRGVRRGNLDAVRIPERPLDILAQQIVAETSSQEWSVDALFELCRRAHPYRQLTREEFEETLTFLSEGLTEASGRGRALLYYDRVGGRLRSRPVARALAVGNAGAIPETGQYRVVAVPENTVIGSVDEDFAVESLRGDVFQLGNQSWRIEHVRSGDVVVSDAQGAPPTIPFWFGEAPGRTIELSTEVSDLREELADRCDDPEAAAEWLVEQTDCPPAVADQVVEYLRTQIAAIGLVPSQRRVVFERFFDETGGMQLVIHAPFGGAVNRAWGYALRKRFCRSFDFELQATADDDGVILSLGPQHSFPLESLFGMLTSANVAGLLEQAILVQPPFQLRWRWNVTRALLVPRQKFGKKVPPALQRFRADDLLTAVFPQLTGCQENHTGDIELPDHPLVRQTMHDCLHEALDLPGLQRVLQRIEAGEIRLIGRDTREPSPFCYELLNAYPYAFLDGGEIQERRTRATPAGSALTPDAPPLTWLDPAAIQQVVAEATPWVRNRDELHDLLLGVILWPVGDGGAPDIAAPEVTADWRGWFHELELEHRAFAVRRSDGTAVWIAAERWPAAATLLPECPAPAGWSPPPGVRTDWDAIAARIATCRGWLEFCGPVTAARLAAHLGWSESQTFAVLEALEGEGTAVRGRFSPPPTESTDAPSAAVEWCHRRLLARIHRQTLAGLRRQVEPVDVSVFQRFLWRHHGLVGEPRTGVNGLFEVVSQLQGLDLPAICWERDILPLRLANYEPGWLDELCLAGEAGWGRLYPPEIPADKPRAVSNLTRVVPISLFLRDDLPWLLTPTSDAATATLGGLAAEIWELLQRDGALFAADLLQATRMLPSHLEDALGELISRGLVTADSLAGLRSLIAERQDLVGRPVRRGQAGLVRRRVVGTVSGRWSIWRRSPPGETLSEAERLTAWAWQLVRRWGIVFRDLLAREDGAPRWWELVPIFRRLEARGELRGGRFITGVAGEQFGLETSVQELRRLRDADAQPDLVVINAADPLNLAGVITAPPRVPAAAQNRLAYQRGRLAAVRQNGETVWCVPLPSSEQEAVLAALDGRTAPSAGDGREAPAKAKRKPRRPDYPNQIPRPLIS